jgi:hypothetical protein
MLKKGSEGGPAQRSKKQKKVEKAEKRNTSPLFHCSLNIMIIITGQD